MSIVFKKKIISIPLLCFKFITFCTSTTFYSVKFYLKKPLGYAIIVVVLTFYIYVERRRP